MYLRYVNAAIAIKVKILKAWLVLFVFIYSPAKRMRMYWEYCEKVTINESNVLGILKLFRLNKLSRSEWYRLYNYNAKRSRVDVRFLSSPQGQDLLKGQKVYSQLI